MDANRHFRGKLFSVTASLVLFLSSELLKWQFPVVAASEKIALLAAALRSTSEPFALQLVRR